MSHLTPEELFRRTHRGLARLRASQRQLLQDIQQRYDELGMAVHQLRSFFNDSDDTDTDTETPSEYFSVDNPNKSFHILHISKSFFLNIFHINTHMDLKNKIDVISMKNR